MATDVGTLEFSDRGSAAPARVPAQGRLSLGGRLLGHARLGAVVGARCSACCPEYAIVDVPPDHPIRHTMFDVDEDAAGDEHQLLAAERRHTSERGSDSPHANFRMIADETGRIMVLMTHNTDIGDSWEREGEDREFFLQFSPDGYALGINVVLYALTH